MKMQTQQADIGKQLLDAAMQAAMPGDDIAVPVLAATDPAVNKNDGKTGPHRLQGAGPGRPKGVRNKLTNLRDAVIEAFDRVGGADYLVKLAGGTQSDRAAFVSLMNKVLPTQINQQVDGGIKLELSWLSGRSIGSTTAQTLEHRTQVIDLERDSDGEYRIKDQTPQPGGGQAQAGGTTPGAAGDARDA